MSTHDVEASAKATITHTTTSACPHDNPVVTVDALVQRARNYAGEAKDSATDAAQQAAAAETHRLAAQDAATNAREFCDHARHHAATVHTAAVECKAAVGEVRDTSRALASELHDLQVVLAAQAKCGPDRGDGAPGRWNAPPPCPPTPALAPPCIHTPGRPADEIAASMSQLNTLLLGASPAFAQAMRMQTDAIASGLGVLNAISNQQSHHALELAATARGIVEVHQRKPSGGD